MHTSTLALLTASLLLLVLLVIVVDRIYQRYSHLWTNEPPLFPYTIPFVGHALWYGSDRQSLFRAAAAHFPDCEPYSFLFFGHRVYVFTNQRDVSLIFRKSKSLPFLPLIEKLSGLAWGISPAGMKLLSEPDSKTGESLFMNAHAFYRDALKAGPGLDRLTVSFLRFLGEAFDDFERTNEGKRVNFQHWSKTMLGIASTNAMMGTSLLLRNPAFLDAVFTTDSGFFYFVNRVPRIFGRRIYEARDLVLGALKEYFDDEGMVGESVPMIKDREKQLRAKGLKTEDVAAYSFSAYVAFVTNATNIAYQMIRHIYRNKDALERLRAEVAPAFTNTFSPDGAPASGSPVPTTPTNPTPHQTLTTLPQVQFLLTQCPLLRAYYSETLRLYSASPSNRVVTETLHIGIGTSTGKPRTIYAGHNLMCPPYIQHHMTDLFGEDTGVFNPERFIVPLTSTSPPSSTVGGTGTGTGKPANPNNLRSFGGGISLCSGRHFAGNEVLSYAASVVWRFDVEFLGGGGAGGGGVRIRRRKVD